jgi:lysophospholipase L1-like esterase
MTLDIRQSTVLGLGLKIVAAAATTLQIFTLTAALSAQGKGEHWVSTWATALVDLPLPAPAQAGGQGGGQGSQGLQGGAPQGPPTLTSLNDQTLRQIVRVSLGGQTIRVVLSNAFGTAPLRIGAAHVALRDQSAAIVAASGRALTFNGSGAVALPAGASIVSDPVNLTVPALADVAIDIFIPGDTKAEKLPLTTHTGAQQTGYVSTVGNHAGKRDMPVAQTTQSWFFLARVEVIAPAQAGAVVALGDSITDGSRSTVDSNNRWPNELARRLVAQKAATAVLDLGIGGNRLLLDITGPNALARFDRDVLAQSGVTHLIVLEGINDIRHTGVDRDLQLPKATAAELIMAHKQLIERAHAHGVKVIGGLLTPFEGSLWTPEAEATRKALNDWIANGKAYDAVVDFDAVVRDPNRPTQLNPKFDSGDHIHPNDAGYQAMGSAIDLALFKTGLLARTN